MQAWQCDDVRPVPNLILGDVVRPAPGPGEILVQIHAAAVTPTELLWYPSTRTKSGEVRSRAVPGHEFSGVVTEVGVGADFTLGEEVCGMNDWFDNGAMAEFCRTLPSHVIRKPAGLSHTEAATVPISGLTAWQGLFEKTQLQPGERVLVHGGAGAVGIFAVQLAKWRGAHVTTTASARHRDFLTKLGADQVIDYHTERFEDLVEQPDVVFDAVGGETLQRSWNVLGPAGRLVTVAASSEVETDARAKRAFFIVEPQPQQLREIFRLLESGRLTTVINAEIPFEEAGRAYSSKSKAGRGCGKSVVTINH